MRQETINFLLVIDASQEPANATQLAAAGGISHVTACKKLEKMRRESLVNFTRVGATYFYQLSDEGKAVLRHELEVQRARIAANPDPQHP